MIVFSQDGKPYYVINPGNKPLTDNRYTENHYFDGSARYTGNITANGGITGKNVYANEWFVGKNAQINELITSKYASVSEKVTTKDAEVTNDITAGNNVKAENELRGESVICNKMGIGGGAVQDVEWVWNPQMERYCLCTIT